MSEVDGAPQRRVKATGSGSPFIQRTLDSSAAMVRAAPRPMSSAFCSVSALILDLTASAGSTTSTDALPSHRSCKGGQGARLGGHHGKERGGITRPHCTTAPGSA